MADEDASPSARSRQSKRMSRKRLAEMLGDLLKLAAKALGSDFRSSVGGSAATVVGAFVIVQATDLELVDREVVERLVADAVAAGFSCGASLDDPVRPVLEGLDPEHGEYLREVLKDNKVCQFLGQLGEPHGLEVLQARLGRLDIDAQTRWPLLFGNVRLDDDECCLTAEADGVRLQESHKKRLDHLAVALASSTSPILVDVKGSASTVPFRLRQCEGWPRTTGSAAECSGELNNGAAYLRAWNASQHLRKQVCDRAPAADVLIKRVKWSYYQGRDLAQRYDERADTHLAYLNRSVHIRVVEGTMEDVEDAPDGDWIKSTGCPSKATSVRARPEEPSARRFCVRGQDQVGSEGERCSIRH